MPSPKKRAPRKGAASKRPPTLSEDFVALLGEFENARVEYVIVGGYAVGIHGRPRATKDLDLWIAGGENLARVEAALIAFGMPESFASTVRRTKDDEVVWFGVAPGRVDLLRAIDGVDVGQLQARAVRARFEKVEAWVIGLDDLIANKRAAGRPQDLVDVKALEKIRSAVT